MATAELDASVSLGVATDYVLSTPYSLKNTVSGTHAGGAQTRARIGKSFTTPNKDIVYAIMDIRMHHGGGQGGIQNCKVQWNSTLLIFLGKPYDGTSSGYVPENKWIRIVVPLPKNTAVDIRLI